MILFVKTYLSKVFLTKQLSTVFTATELLLTVQSNRLYSYQTDMFMDPNLNLIILIYID